MSIDRVVRKPLRVRWLARSKRLVARSRRWLRRNWRWLSVVVALAGFPLIAYVVLKLAPDWFAETRGLDPKGRAEARQGVRTASLALLAGLIAVVGALYTARSFTLNRAGQLTDRFNKAIEQLGNKEALEVRLGGIYALERIARDSKEDHPQVVEVLTAYVREHAPMPDTPGSDNEAKEAVPPVFPARTAPGRPYTDVQAALTVLGRRTLAPEQDARPALDLSSTHLIGADLSKANLRQANLTKANLSEANLSEANLTKADLSEANLMQANVLGADLSEAYHWEANFSRTRYDQRTTWPADLNPAEAGAWDVGPFLGRRG